MTNEPAVVPENSVAVSANEEIDEKTLIALARQISGPLPSSREFAGYEQALPGSANRILVYMEQEAAQRQENEKTLIKETLRLSFRGQNCGMATIIISAALIALSMVLKQPLAAIAPCILAIGTLATIFFGKKQ